jgi:hypothetical protein
MVPPISPLQLTGEEQDGEVHLAPVSADSRGKNSWVNFIVAALMVSVIATEDVGHGSLTYPSLL